MNKTFQKLGAWSGFVAVNLFFAGLVATSFFPPLSPSLSMEQVAQLYQAHQFGILFGGSLLIIAGGILGPFNTAMFLQLRRMEGPRPVGAYAQMLSGCANMLFFILPGLAFVIAAFRPDRSPEVLSALNDMAWLVTLLPWSLGMVQVLCVGIAVLSHGTATSVYPRWLGFYSVWTSIGMITSCVIPFFKSGPFAWNGVVGFWIPAVVGGTWYVVMWWMTLKAINNEDGA